MAKKLKRYGHSQKFIRGFQINMVCSAYTNKDAMAALEINQHTMNNWVSVGTPTDQLLLDNVGVPYAYFDSGELCYAYKDKRYKLMPLNEMSALIENIREKFKTYDETIKHFSK